MFAIVYQLLNIPKFSDTLTYCGLVVHKICFSGFRATHLSDVINYDDGSIAINISIQFYMHISIK